MKSKVLNTYMYLKTKLFTASIFFTLAVILLGTLTFIELPCPACGGTGFITGVKGLEITKVEAELVDHEIVGLECGWDYERYTYDLKISVENKSTTPLAYGMIEVTFHDPESSRTRTIEEDDEEIEVTDVGGIISADTIFVEGIAAQTARTIEETIVFDGVTLEVFDVEIHQVLAHTAEEFACPFHSEETTKVPLTKWLKLR